MANEIQFSFAHGAVTYCLVRNNIGQIWNTPTNAFVNYSTANYSGYCIFAIEQGAASSYYTANMPSAPPGSYNAVAKQQLGSNPAETDPTVDVGSVQWNGSGVASISDIPPSGQNTNPVQLQRGVQVLNYEFYLRSSADHVTPLTSGICSGQISQDGGAFGPMGLGIFTEIGQGMYAVTLTSGDTSCNTMGLIFNAFGVSGGSSDPTVQTFVLQHSSGY